jgi:hypothetical protein
MEWWRLRESSRRSALKLLNLLTLKMPAMFESMAT